MKTLTVILAGIAGLLAVLVFVAALVSVPVMLLWDWLMPTIFGLPEITWFQAWGLLLLCGLLFKSHTPVKD
jgi:hypothetical protein